LRVRQGLDLGFLQQHLEECEGQRKGGVYVGVPQQILALDGGILRLLLSRDYSFYNHHGSTNELVWYKWVRAECGDIVPKYATSIEGAGCLVLSPDEKRVLLVFEYGRWGRIGGAVDPGEGMLECARREAQEETGVVFDESFTPQLALYYHQPISRDGLINDNFCLFVLRAADTQLKVCLDEVDSADWLPVDELVAAWNAAKSGDAVPDQVEVLGKRIGTMELTALAKYLEGRCQTPVWSKGKRTKPGMMF